MFATNVNIDIDLSIRWPEQEAVGCQPSDVLGSKGIRNITVPVHRPPETAAVPRIGGVVAKILCSDVQSLLAQVPKAVIAVRMATRESIENDLGRHLVVRDRHLPPCDLRTAVKPVEVQVPHTYDQDPWGSGGRTGNATCTCGLMASTASWKVTTTMAGLRRRRQFAIPSWATIDGLWNPAIITSPTKGNPRDSLADPSWRRPCQA